MVYETEGGWDYPSQTLTCTFLYESVESFYVHFEEKLKEKQKEFLEFKKIEEKYNKKKQKSFDNTRWFLDYPQRPDLHFEFNSYKFNFENFYDFKNNKIEMPKIFELEEWFDFYLRYQPYELET